MNECVFAMQEHETSQNWLLRVCSPAETTEFSLVPGNFININSLKALGHMSFVFLHQVPLREPTLVFCFVCYLFWISKKSTNGTGFLNFNFDSSNGFIKIFLANIIYLRKVILMTFDKSMQMRKMTCFSVKFWYIYCNNYSLNVFLCPTWSPGPQEWLTIWQNWLLSRRHDI